MLKTPRLSVIPLGLMPDEWVAISALNIKAAGNTLYDYFGEANDSLYWAIANFLQSFAAPQKAHHYTVAKALRRLTNQEIQRSEAEAAWLHVRIQQPTREFVLPRWHKDGSFDGNTTPVFKLIFTLSGAITRFAETENEWLFDRLESELIQLAYAEKAGVSPAQTRVDELHIRSELDHVVTEIFPADRGQGVRFLIGRNGIPHSEPNTRKPRIVCTVVAGSHEEIAKSAAQQGSYFFA